MVHDSEHVIARESLPTHRHHGHIGLSGVKLADLVIPHPPGVAAGVGVLVLRDDAKQGGVHEGQWADTSHTASGASTLQGVGGTTVK